MREHCTCKTMYTHTSHTARKQTIHKRKDEGANHEEDHEEDEDDVHLDVMSQCPHRAALRRPG
jgi:hypothetical protein